MTSGIRKYFIQIVKIVKSHEAIYLAGQQPLKATVTAS